MNKSSIKEIVVANVNGRSTTTYKHLGSMHDPLTHGNWSKGAGMYGGAAAGKLSDKVKERLRVAMGTGAKTTPERASTFGYQVSKPTIPNNTGRNPTAAQRKAAEEIVSRFSDDQIKRRIAVYYETVKKTPMASVIINNDKYVERQRERISQDPAIGKRLRREHREGQPLREQARKKILAEMLLNEPRFAANKKFFPEATPDTSPIVPNMVTQKHLGSMHDPLSHGNWSKGAGMYGGKGAKSSLAKKVGERLRTEVGLKPIGTRGKPGQRKGRGSIPTPTLEQATARLGERNKLSQGRRTKRRDALDERTILREREEMRQRIANQGKFGNRSEKPYSGPEHSWVRYGGNPKANYKPTEKDRAFAAKWKYDMYEREAMDMLSPKNLSLARRQIKNNQIFGKNSTTDEILATGPRGKSTDTPMVTGQKRGTWVRNMVRRLWDRDDAREDRVMDADPFFGKRADVEKYIPSETLTRMEYQSTKEFSTKEIKGIVTANVNKRVKSSSYKALANIMVTQKHLGSMHDPLSHGNWSKGAGMYGGALAKKIGDRLRNALGAGKIAVGKLAGAAGRAVRSATSPARTAQLPPRRLRREAAREATREAARTERTTRAARTARTAQTIQGVKDKITELGATMRGKKVPLVKPGEAKAPQSQSRLDKLRDLAKNVSQGVKDKLAGAKGAVARAAQLAKDLPSEIGATMRGKKVPPVKPGEAKAPQSQSRLDKLRDLAKNVAQGVKDKVAGAVRGVTGPAQAAQMPARYPLSRREGEAKSRRDKLRDLAKNVTQGVKDKITELGATMRGKKVPLVKPSEAKTPQSQSRLDKLRDLAKGVAQGVKDKVTELGATMRGKKITAEANKKIDVARDTANNGGIPSSAISRGMQRPQLRPGGMGRPQLRPDGMQRPELRPTKKPSAPKTKDQDWYNVSRPNNNKPNANGLGTKINPSEAIKAFLRAALIIGGVTLAAGGAGAVGDAVGGAAGAVGNAAGAVGDAVGNAADAIGNSLNTIISGAKKKRKPNANTNTNTNAKDA